MSRSGFQQHHLDNERENRHESSRAPYDRFDESWIMGWRNVPLMKKSWRRELNYSQNGSSSTGGVFFFQSAWMYLFGL